MPYNHTTVVRAALGLAIAFTFSCSGNDNGNEQSYNYCISANNTCLVGPFTASTCTGQLSNSCPNGGGGSSSSKSNSSSSSFRSSGSLSSSSIGGGSSSSSNVPTINTTFTDDRDGKSYRYVEIGNQTWMAENLNYAATGSMCYSDRESNCDKYGRTYNWSMAKTVCPSGWHLPTKDEWDVLKETVGGNETAGKVLKAKDGWFGNGTDDYDFSALPGGRGVFNADIWSWGGATTTGIWWSASEYNNYKAYAISMTGSSDGTFWLEDATAGFQSVRCLQGSSVLSSSSSSLMASSSSTVPSSSSSSLVPSSSSIVQSSSSFSYPDKGNNIANYKTTKIGNQVWMAENLNYNVDGSKCYAEGVGGVSADSIAKNCGKYGRLYNWATAMALPDSCEYRSCSSLISAKHKGICPSGWHLPSDADWNVLMKFVNPNCSDRYCAGAGTKLKTTSGWNNYGNGNDNYGFSALPGGGNSDGSFNNVGYYGYWWTTTADNYYAVIRPISCYDDGVSWTYSYKVSLQSVRCVQD